MVLGVQLVLSLCLWNIYVGIGSKHISILMVKCSIKMLDFVNCFLKRRNRHKIRGICVINW
jgi:hypothetical protein